MTMQDRLIWGHFGGASPAWFGDEDEAALIDLRSGRLIGHYEHDGDGKWSMRVCLGYWRALRTVWRQPARLIGLAGFPRVWVGVLRSESHDAAVETIEGFLGEVTSVIERDVYDD